MAYSVVQTIGKSHGVSMLRERGGCIRLLRTLTLYADQFFLAGLCKRRTTDASTRFTRTYHWVHEPADCRKMQSTSCPIFIDFASPFACIPDVSPRRLIFLYFSFPPTCLSCTAPSRRAMSPYAHAGGLYGHIVRSCGCGGLVP